jgi:hypothetical protein
VLWVEIIVGLAVLLGVAFLASRDLPGLEDEPTDHADLGLPVDRSIHSQDIAGLRLRTVSAFWGGLRGYRYDDVDTVLSRVEETLREHETEPEQPASTERQQEWPRRPGRSAHGRDVRPDSG